MLGFGNLFQKSREKFEVMNTHKDVAVSLKKIIGCQENIKNSTNSDCLFFLFYSKLWKWVRICAMDIWDLQHTLCRNSIPVGAKKPCKPGNLILIPEAFKYKRFLKIIQINTASVLAVVARDRSWVLAAFKECPSLVRSTDIQQLTTASGFSSQRPLVVSVACALTSTDTHTLLYFSVPVKRHNTFFAKISPKWSLA